MRWRAVSLPALCSRSRRSGPPPASASSEVWRSSSIRSRCLPSGIKLRLGSDNGSSLGRGILRGKNAHGEMRGEPDGPEKQHDTQEQLCAHGGVVLDARGMAGDKTLQENLAFEAGDVLRRVIANAGNQVAVGDEMAWPHIFKRARAGSKQTLARLL